MSGARVREGMQKYPDVVKAFMEGATVAWKAKGTKEWVICENPTWSADLEWKVVLQATICIGTYWESDRLKYVEGKRNQLLLDYGRNTGFEITEITRLNAGMP